MSNARNVRGLGLALALTAVYLILELSFNARLLDVAGAAADRRALEGVEFFGRSLSGLGATLLLWRAVGTWRGHLSLGLFLALGAVTGPAVYFGQKALVEGLVERASPAERKYATFAATLASATLQHAAQLKGLAIDDKDYASPQGKTFFAVFPALVYASPVLVERISAQLEPLMAQAVRAQAGTADEAYGQHYVPLTNELRQMYNTRYVPASNRLGHATSGDAAEGAWHVFQDKLALAGVNPQSASGSQRAIVIRKLRKQGVAVPDGYQLDDKDGFIAAYPSATAGAHFDQEASAFFGFKSTLPPGLSWPAFSRHADVQRYVRQRLSARLPSFKPGSGVLDLDASFEAFRDRMYEPRLTQEAQRRSAALRLDISSYASGGANDEVGRRAMRAVLVPPLALGFSLFFGLLNLIGLATAALPLPSWGRAIAKLACCIALVVVPLTLSNTVTASSGYIKLEGQLREHSGATFGYGLRWLAQAEPLFYPLTSRVHRWALADFTFTTAAR